MTEENKTETISEKAEPKPNKATKKGTPWSSRTKAKNPVKTIGDFIRSQK